MRPLSLSLQNFLSYGNQPQVISFENESIVSFIGNNGHGKSALLEAMTWALWGQARRSQGVTKSDDMLLHLGSDEMIVILIIEVKGNCYKIQRSCQKKHNRIYTNLEFYSVINGVEQNLSYAHQKDTQLLIEEIIGISYDMFINTVYLKQGASNEFSKKTPKERKDILCSILKIDQIERIRQNILEDIKKIIQKRDLLLKIEEKLLDKKKEDQLVLYQSQYEEVYKEFSHLNEELSKQKILLSEYEKKKKFLDDKVDSLIVNIGLIDSQIQDLYKIYSDYYFYYKKYKEASFELKEINNSNIVDSKELQFNECDMQEIIKNGQALDLLYVTKKNILVSELQEKIAKINQELTLFLTSFQECSVVQIKQKIGIIDEMIFYIDKSQNSCFLCEQNIIDISIICKKKELLLIEKEALFNLLNTHASSKQEKIFDFEKKKLDLQNKYSLLIEEIDHWYKEEKDKCQKKIDFISAFIKQNSMKIEWEAKKNMFQVEINQFKKKNILPQMKIVIKKIYDLKNEKNILQSEYNAIKIECKILNDTKNNQNILFESINNEYNRKDRESQQLKSYIALLEKQIKEDQKELFSIQQDSKLKEQDLKIKSNLAHILSKNNLQAVLIEEAIPLIEEEANKILGRLTGNESKIYIESIKDLKSGQIKETLDIKIADAVGLRYYEFFSGGESFRIDLALRIALVKLLASKSGNMIKTFIIDEGFGSQDNASLEIIVDTLFMLQNEFDLIIIISHLNDMKEQFPVQFYIEKTIKGSVIQKI